MAAKKKPRKDVKKPVQISFDPHLLKEVDATQETKRAGRSFFVMQAVMSYLKLQREKELEEQVRKAYEGQAAELLKEVEPYLPHQVWGDDEVEILPTPARAARSKR